MTELQKELLGEIDAFRTLGHQFKNKEISAAEFKGKSGGMGVYAQRGGEQFMIRLRTPSGIVSREHLALIDSYARKYGLKQVHFTTRQAVQLHDLDIDEVCDIMADAIVHGLFTRGGGGNFPRNVALSPLAGVERGEAFDPTPYAVETGNYLLHRITGYKLPRKLKISFSNTREDTANSTLNDMGFVADLKDGVPCFQLYLAGGMGGGPAVGIPFGETVAPEDILCHVEAITRLFIAEGNYENKAQARLRFIPRRMGEAEFLACYRGYLEKVRQEMTERCASAVPAVTEEWEPALPAVSKRIPQRQKGRYTVELHPVCGQLATEDLSSLASFMQDKSEITLRLSMEESLYIRNLTAQQADELEALFPHLLATSLGHSVSCIGVPTCQIGVEQSQALCRSILAAFQEENIPEELLPPVHISGCPNSCSRHQVNPLGFAGRKKRVNNQPIDVFELYAGGCHKVGKTKMGQTYGTIPMDQIPAFLIQLTKELQKTGLSFETFLETREDSFRALAESFTV